MIHRRQIYFPVLLTVGLFLQTSFSFAQTVSFDTMRTFSHRKSSSEITGELVKLEKKIATVKTKDRLLEIPVSELSNADQAWLKEAKKWFTQLDRINKEIDGLVKKAESEKPQTRIKACEKIASYGTLGARAIKPLRQLLAKAEEPVDRYLYLLTIAGVLEPTESNLKRTLSLVRLEGDQLHPLADYVASNPGPFLRTVSRYGEPAIPYLTHVGLRVNVTYIEADLKQVGFGSSVALETTVGPKNQLRAQAAEALGMIESRLIAAPLVTIYIRAQTKVNGNEDDETVKAALLAFGGAVVRTPPINNALAKYKKKYPKITTMANNRLKAASERAKAVAEARRLEGTRLLTNRRNGTQVQARFVGLKNGIVEVQDVDRKNLTIKLTDLSREDQQWVEKQAKAAKKKK